VAVLLEAGLLRVVGDPRRVRAIDERFSGRTGRTILIKLGSVPPDPSVAAIPLASQARTCSPRLLRKLRSARIYVAPFGTCAFPRTRTGVLAAVLQLADEFTRQRRPGNTVCGFVAGLFPAQAFLPDQEAETRHD
jgi:hypothetical protein